MKLLIVDDEVSILSLLRTALGVNGEYDCETAASADDALARIAEAHEPFDAFLLDIQMPEKDGIELCRLIRDQGAYEDTPIIMLTAMSQMKYVNAAFAAGATDYVTKPFDFKDLRKRLSDVQNPQPIEAAPEMAHLRPEPAPRISGVQDRPSIEGSFRNEVDIDFRSIDRVIGARELQNYLYQTARSNTDFSTLFAVRVTEADRVLSSLSSAAFLSFLSKVAWAISSETEETGALISYRGNGCFICIENATKNSNLERIGHRLQDMIDAANISDLNAEIAVGRRIVKRFKNPAEAMDALYLAEVAFDTDMHVIRQDKSQPESIDTSSGWRGTLSFLKSWAQKPAGQRVA